METFGNVLLQTNLMSVQIYYKRCYAIDQISYICFNRLVTSVLVMLSLSESR